MPGSESHRFVYSSAHHRCQLLGRNEAARTATDDDGGPAATAPAPAAPPSPGDSARARTRVRARGLGHGASRLVHHAGFLGRLRKRFADRLGRPPRQRIGHRHPRRGAHRHLRPRNVERPPAVPGGREVVPVDVPRQLDELLGPLRRRLRLPDGRPGSRLDELGSHVGSRLRRRPAHVLLLSVQRDRQHGDPDGRRHGAREHVDPRRDPVHGHRGGRRAHLPQRPDAGGLGGRGRLHALLEPAAHPALERRPEHDGLRRRLRRHPCGCRDRPGRSHGRRRSPG